MFSWKITQDVFLTAGNLWNPTGSTVGIKSEKDWRKAASWEPAVQLSSNKVWLRKNSARVGTKLWHATTSLYFNIIFYLLSTSDLPDIKILIFRAGSSCNHCNCISAFPPTFIADPSASPSLSAMESVVSLAVCPRCPRAHTAQITSTFLISPTSRPQTENFSTEPSANSSFPSGRSSHSLSVCTFWGPMMMMNTRLSVLESYSMPVVTVIWYGITAGLNQGLIIRNTPNIHAYVRFHPTREGSFIRYNDMLYGATSCPGKLYSHTHFRVSVARVTFFAGSKEVTWA